MRSGTRNDSGEIVKLSRALFSPPARVRAYKAHTSGSPSDSATPSPAPDRSRGRARHSLSLALARSPPLVSTLVVAAPAPQTAPRPLARAALARVVVGERPQRDSRLALGARRQRVRRLEGGDAEEARVRVLLSHRLKGGRREEGAVRGRRWGAGEEARSGGEEEGGRGLPAGWLPRPFRRSATAPGRMARARRGCTCSSARGAASNSAVSSCGARGTSRPPRSPTGGT